MANAHKAILDKVIFNIVILHYNFGEFNVRQSGTCIRKINKVIRLENIGSVCR